MHTHFTWKQPESGILFLLVITNAINTYEQKIQFKIWSLKCLFTYRWIYFGIRGWSSQWYGISASHGWTLFEWSTSLLSKFRLRNGDWWLSVSWRRTFCKSFLWAQLWNAKMVSHFFSYFFPYLILVYTSYSICH